MDFEQFETGPTNEGLAEVMGLISNLTDLKAEKTAMDEASAGIGARIKTLEEVTIPETMDSHQMRDFTTADGTSVKVKEVIRANITKANEAEAFPWLRDNGHGSLLKREIKIKFGRGEDNMAGEVKALIEEKTGQVPEDKTAVPWNTLTALVKEQLKAGVNLPMEMLGVYLGRKVEIKGAK